MKRVMVTGVGLVTALGVGTDATWDALIAGRSAVGPLRAYDPSSLRTRVGAEIDDFDARAFADRRALRNMTRADQLALAGAVLAVRDAGLEVGDRDRAALYCGGNKEVSDPSKVADATLLARNPDGSVDYRRMGTEGASRFYPLFYVEGLQGAALFYISQALGLRGANSYFAGTADAGATAIATAFRAVRRGEAGVAVAGGFDDAVGWWNMTKLDTLGVLSGRNELGAGACQPYDRQRDGSVLGEGAAFVVLEEREAARARGARAYAEILGAGGGFDVDGHLTPHADGHGLAHALRSALRDAHLAPADVDYVATHGCGTRLGDASEARALRTVMGEDAPPASSVKPAAGHLVGGAGALNVAVAALAAHHGVVPPTLNLTDPDPACDLDWVPGEARELQVEHALALARGLEGQNVAVAVRAA